MSKRVVAAGLGVMVLVSSVASQGAFAAPPAPAPAPVSPAAEAARPASASQGPAVAEVTGQPGHNVQVPMEQLQHALIEGYGLNILLNLLQLNIAKDQAAQRGVTVTPADVEKERAITVDRMFRESNEKQLDKMKAARDKGDTAGADAIAAQIKKDNEQALDQVLQNQHLSHAEFDIVTETNAYLKKIAEPMLLGKISDDNLKQAFNTLYGATIKCRHIQCANLVEINDAKRRLAAGEPFEKVAQAMSRNSGTGPLGGELPPFNLQTQGMPQAFKDAAWALQKEGDISDPVAAEGAYHLIKLEKRIAPKAVKFEDVKESLRADLNDRALDAMTKQLRQQITDAALAHLQINDPVLQQQWQNKLAKRDAQIKDRNEMRKQMDAERERGTTQPAAPDLSPAGPAARAPAEPAPGAAAPVAR